MSKENPNPDLGQHFLENEKILSKFIETCNIKEKDKIIEIGAGTGIVTKALLEKNPAKILAFEIDRKFEPELKKIKLDKDSTFVNQFDNSLSLDDVKMIDENKDNKEKKNDYAEKEISIYLTDKREESKSNIYEY